MDEAVAAMPMVYVVDAALVVVGGLLLVLSWWRAMEWKRHRAFWHGIAAAELATDEGEMPAVQRDFLRMVLAGERRGAFTEEAPRLRNAWRVEWVLAWRARAARIEAAPEPVVIRMRVSRWGLPAEILVARSSGNPGFDAAAARAFRHARFAPARVFGRAVSVWVEVPFTIHPPALNGRPGTPAPAAGTSSSGAFSGAGVNLRGPIRRIHPPNPFPSLELHRCAGEARSSPCFRWRCACLPRGCTFRRTWPTAT